MIKKALLISLLTLSIFSCGVKKNMTYQSRPLYKSYKITKVDSLNNFYLIYCRSDLSIFKIVSKKGIDKCDNTLKLGETYLFRLESILSKRVESSPVRLQLPTRYLEIECFEFDKQTKIC